MEKYANFAGSSAASQTDSAVVPSYRNFKPLIRTLSYRGGTAADAVKIYPATLLGKTTVEDAAADDATSIDLVGDSGANDTINGVTVTTSDFVILTLDGIGDGPSKNGYQLAAIGALGGATSGTIDITTLTPFDGGTGLDAAIVAGATAWIVFASDVVTIDIDTNSDTIYDVAVGGAGTPIGVALVSAGANQHDFGGTVKYVR